jgi:hypothetical protein
MISKHNNNLSRFYKQVARDTLQSVKGIGGYSALQVVELAQVNLTSQYAPAHPSSQLSMNKVICGTVGFVSFEKADFCVVKFGCVFFLGEQVDAFFSSLMMIIVSELGDKTVKTLPPTHFASPSSCHPPIGSACRLSRFELIFRLCSLFQPT